MCRGIYALSLLFKDILVPRFLDKLGMTHPSDAFYQLDKSEFAGEYKNQRKANRLALVFIRVS